MDDLVERALAPALESPPCGPDLEYDPQCLELEAALRSQARPETDAHATAVEAPADWSWIERRALSLLDRSKDLRLAVTVTRAWTCLHGAPGLAAGFALLTGLVERYWHSLHPALDATEDDDPTARLSALAALIHHEALLADVRGHTIVWHGLDPVRWRDIEHASGHDLERLTGASRVAPETALAATAALQRCQALRRVLVERLGPDLAPDLSPLIRLIEALQFACRQVLEAPGEPPTASEGGSGWLMKIVLDGMPPPDRTVFGPAGPPRSFRTSTFAIPGLKVVLDEIPPSDRTVSDPARPPRSFGASPFAIPGPEVSAPEPGQGGGLWPGASSGQEWRHSAGFGPAPAAEAGFATAAAPPSAPEIGPPPPLVVDPPAAPETPAEAVLLGVSAPRTVKPAEAFPSRFVAYVPSVEDRVRNLLTDLDGDSAHPVLGLTPDRMPRWRVGTPVTVRLYGGHATVTPPERSFEWNGTQNLVHFTVTPAPDATTLTLEYEALIGGVPVASIPLVVRVGADSSPLTELTTKPLPRTAFASYSSQDADLVALCLSTLSRWDPGLDVFMDCLDLTPNAAWKAELERVIARVDTFLLFWSRHAMTSPWVGWEWQTARDKRGLDIIRPFPLDDPALAPPPEALQHLHFRDRFLVARQAMLRIAEVLNRPPA